MIPAIILGKHHSSGLPGKNYMEVVGRPMVEYAILANKYSQHVDSVFVSTDSGEIKKVAKKHNCKIIDRPDRLATSEAPSEKVVCHAVDEIEDRTGERVEICSVGYANAPHIPEGMIDEGIEKLQSNGDLDTAFSVSKFNMFTPIRARVITEDGLIEPFDQRLHEDSTATSNRQSSEDCYFIDWAVQIIRRRTIKAIENNDIDPGNPPFKQLGESSAALHNDPGFDVDTDWQLPVIKQWLQDHGYTKYHTPYDDE